MKIKSASFILFLCFLLAACFNQIISDKNSKNFYNKCGSFLQDEPIYKHLPGNNESIRRIGGTSDSANRGLVRGLVRGGEALPIIVAPIAPRHVGFTTSASPVLYIYISSSIGSEIEFVLNEQFSFIPILKTKIEFTPGQKIIAVNLSTYNILLKPETEYEWFAALVLDKKERSADIVGSAVIKYVAPLKEMLKSINSLPFEKLYFMYAEKGYYYDAVKVISELIDKTPDFHKLRCHRASLFTQAGLSFAAEYDMGSIIL